MQLKAAGSFVWDSGQPRLRLTRNVTPYVCDFRAGVLLNLLVSIVHIC
jgi:hypothetical protein